MMQIYYGPCPACCFVYAVADRLPNFCPECGNRIFTNYEEARVARLRVREVTEKE